MRIPQVAIHWVFAFVAAGTALLQGAGVKARFDPQDPAVGPFPTDFLTTPDARQVTGKRINLPLPDCAAEPSTCDELRLVNQFDGFSLMPRARVRFSAPINPDTLRQGLFYVWLDPSPRDPYNLGPVGQVTPINQVSYDPSTNTAFARPDDAFDQSRRYALIVTDGVRDRNGDPVESEEGFTLCLNAQIGGEYCVQLGRDVQTAASAVAPRRIVGGSVFTTMTATAFMESARRQVIRFAPAARQSVRLFDAQEIASVRIQRQVRTTGDKFQSEPLLIPFSLLAQAGLGRVAFGEFTSPRFLGADQAIAQIPTGQEAAFPETVDSIAFQIFLPATPPPPGGYPVAIVQHGLTDDRLGGITSVALGFMSQGIAMIAFNAVGHGGGPEGTVELTLSNGSTVSLPFGGRGVDRDGDGVIDNTEGAVLFTPGPPIAVRDSTRQTALDQMVLVQRLRQPGGLDTAGTAQLSLDRDRIFYLGMSFGSFIGTVFHALEPQVLSAVLNVGGGSAADAGRWSPTLRPLLRMYLGTRRPSVLNAGSDFVEDQPLRFQAVRVIQSPSSVRVQEVMERLEWMETPGMPAAFAPHLKSATLPGVPVKRTLFQFAVGDRTVPNPSNFMLVRWANIWESTSVYRSDLAQQVIPALTDNPHIFLLGGLNAAVLSVAVAAQTQAALFLLGTGEAVPDINPLLRRTFNRDVFEPVSYLLEQTNLPGTP